MSSNVATEIEISFGQYKYFQIDILGGYKQVVDQIFLSIEIH